MNRQALKMKLALCIAVVLTIFTVLLAGEQDSDRVVITALISARIDMMASSPEKAASKFSGIAANFPESEYADDALVFAGKCLTSLQRYDDAIKVFRQIVDRYPAGTLVINGSWFSSMAEITGETSKGIPAPLRKPPSELVSDAQKAIHLYESYMKAYPERTADCARYEMARIYHGYLHDDKKAAEILDAVRQDPVETAKRSKQDKIFQERMDQLIMDRLRDDYSPILRIEPEHRLELRVRGLREKVGLAAPAMIPQLQESEIQKQANARVEEFFRAIAPRFSEKKESKGREGDSSRPDATEAFQASVATLGDPSASPVDRNRAVVMLGQLANPEAVPVLIKFITSPEVPVAQNAIRALAEIKDPRSVPPLLKLIENPPQLEEDDAQVLQARAISALGAIGDASVLDVLKRVAGRAELPENLREAAKIAVDRIEKRKSQTSTENPASTTAK